MAIKPIDVTGMVEEMPVCPMCGCFIEINDDFTIAHAEGAIFLIHYECGNVEFFDA